MNTAAAPGDAVATSVTADPAPKPSFGDIPLACIRASKTNPRKIFNDDDLNDLAKSIKVQGVAQPILVRPVEVVDDVTYFEIVAGERRFRASGLAGMPTVPAIVRELSDQAAYEIQVLENLQRVDLHPLEEAEGFEVMMSKYKDTADQLAEKIGKSKAYIYASLKLCNLIPEAREAFYKGLLTKSTALLVARIPVKAMQATCVTEITKGYQGPLSTRSAANHIEHQYMLNIKKANFKQSDADLLPVAGPCTACPKRTGNQPEIFVDVNADVCTDPTCFKAKSEAHVIRIKQVATAKGQVVFSGAAAKKIMPSFYSDMVGYVDLDKKNYQDAENRTWRQILGKKKPAVSLLENPHSQDFIEVVSLEDIEPILKELGIKSDRKTAAEEEASKAREKQQALKGKIEQEFRRQLFEAAHHASLMMNLVDADLRLVACQVFSRIGGGTIAQAAVLRLHGWTKETIGYGRGEPLRAAVDALSPAQLNQFIRDCTLCGELETYSYTPNDPPKNLLEFAARAKVDAKKIRSDIEAAAKEKADLKKKAAAKMAAKANPAPAPTATTATTAPAKPAIKSSTSKAAKRPSKLAAAASPTTSEGAAAPATQDVQTPAVPALNDSGKTAAWPFPTTSRPPVAVVGAAQ